MIAWTGHEAAASTQRTLSCGLRTRARESGVGIGILGHFVARVPAGWFG
jgi:hypothetical protein